MKSLFSIFFCALSFSGLCQNLTSLSGRIIDVDTKEPIPFANVFLANTTMCTVSRGDGAFQLEKIPEGRYDITVSIMGYRLFSTPVSFSGEQVNLTIELKQEVVQLPEVVMKSDAPDFDRYYDVFKHILLGETTNSRKCIIKNPQDLFIEFDTDENVLRAYATKPIEVENRALGYTLFYVLTKFEVDYKKEQHKVLGVPRFESIEPKSSREIKIWNRNRDEAYFGSVQHFMRSLLNRQLAPNDFKIYQIAAEEELQVDEKFLLSNDSTSIVHFKGDLKVVFIGESEASAYPTSIPYLYSQTSVFHFSNDSITLYPNGYFEDVKSVTLEGYLAWEESLGNLLPLGFEPQKKSKL